MSNANAPAGLFLLVQRVEEVPEELAAVLLAAGLEPGRPRRLQELVGRVDGALRVAQEGEGALQPQQDGLRRRQGRGQHQITEAAREGKALFHHYYHYH